MRANDRVFVLSPVILYIIKHDNAWKDKVIHT